MNRRNSYEVPRSLKSGIQFGNFEIIDILILVIGLIVSGIVLVSFGGLSNLLILKLVLIVIIMLGSFTLTLGGEGLPKIRTIIKNMFKYMFRHKKYAELDLYEDLGVKIEDDCFIHSTLTNEYSVCIEIESNLFNTRDDEEKWQIIQNLKGMYAFTNELSLIKLDIPIDISKYEYNNRINLDENKIYESKEFNKNKKAQYLAKREYLKAQRKKIESFYSDNKTAPRFFLFIYNSKKEKVVEEATQALNILSNSKIHCGIANKELIDLIFRNYYYPRLDNKNTLYVNEWEEHSSYIKIKYFKDKDGNDITQNYKIFCLTALPREVGDSWLYSLCNVPNVKMISKIEKVTDLSKVKSGINKSIMELRSRMKGKIDENEELSYRIESLNNLILDLNAERECVHAQKFYFLVPVEYSKEFINRAKSSTLKIDKMLFRQANSFKEMHFFRFLPKKRLKNNAISLTSTVVSAEYPFITPTFFDKKGEYIGQSFGLPLFFDPFAHINDKVDNRVNGNIIITGASGMGKSYLSKILLLNMMNQAKKVRILDPENEYKDLCINYSGNYVNTAGGDKIINPLQVFKTMNKDEDEEATPVTNHKQFLESFFKSLFKKIENDDELWAYLSTAIDAVYNDFHILDEVELSDDPKDYPILQDLYKKIIFLKTIAEEKREVKEANLYKTLELLIKNYVNNEDGSMNGKSKLWNNYTSINTDNSLIVFNFQQMLSGFSKADSSAQMILVMQFLNQEIIANREYNKINNKKEKITIMIDEAHNFVKKERPEALTFMLRMAKQIRKYNGNIIVTTQQINDFLGGDEDTKKKSEGIITNCQYSFIGGNPNAIESLINLYGGIYPFSEEELQLIKGSSRGVFLFQRDSNTRTTLFVEGVNGVSDFFEGNKIINQINEELKERLLLTNNSQQIIQ